MNISVHPMRVCVSGYTVKFLYHIGIYRSLIKSPKVKYRYK